MKKNSANQLRLGVFVTSGLFLFIAGIYFIGERQQMFSSTFHISAVFKDISGLQVGNNVRFCGINAGIIENIEQITDSTVVVDMQIEERTRKFMKKNVRAIIGSDGLMGNKIVLIIPGAPITQVIADNDIIQTEQAVSMDDILLKIKVTSEHAANMTGDLAVIVKNIRDGKGTIGKLFMDSVFADNLDETVVNIKQGTKGFKTNMDAASHNFLLRGFLKKKANKEKKEKEKKEEKEKSPEKK